jgi:hypothetical protein
MNKKDLIFIVAALLLTRVAKIIHVFHANDRDETIVMMSFTQMTEMRP